MVVLFALILIPDLLGRSLVPSPILLVLAGIPVCVSTIPVMVLLYFAGKRFRLESPKSCGTLILIGSPPLTLLVLWLFSLVVGGVGFFIPRL